MHPRKRKWLKMKAKAAEEAAEKLAAENLLAEEAAKEPVVEKVKKTPPPAKEDLKPKKTIRRPAKKLKKK